MDEGFCVSQILGDAQRKEIKKKKSKCHPQHLHVRGLLKSMLTHNSVIVASTSLMPL
jgi:hypothetical protein